MGWDLIESGVESTDDFCVRQATVIKLKFDRGTFHGSLDGGFAFMNVLVWGLARRRER